MPFSNSFIQNYAGYQDHPFYLYDQPDPINGRSTNTVEASKYNPQKTVFGRNATAIFYTQSLSASSTLATIYPGRRSAVPRINVSYSEAITDWNDTTEAQRLQISFTSFIVDNTDSFDYTFDGVQLIDGLNDPPLPADFITLTRDGSVGSFPRYTFTEDKMMHEFTELRTVSSPTNVFTQIKRDPRRQEFVSNALIPGTEVDTTPVSMYVMGVFDIARFNFPSTIVLSPGDSLSIALGTLDYLFYAKIVP